MSKIDQLQRKREIRLRIGRMRRRINNRLHGVQSESRRLLSWREYVSRFPSYALFAAFGIGLAASGGFRKNRLFRKLGLQIARQTMSNAGQHLWQELQRIWTQTGVRP